MTLNQMVEPVSGNPFTKNRRPLDPFSGVLGMVVPGAGHFVQKRFFKGFVFLGCIYFLFFYGWILGNYSNVYLPRATDCQPRGKTLTTITYGPLSIPFPKALYYRLQFAGQVWVGAVAWPALIQFWSVDEEDLEAEPIPILGRVMRAPPEQLLNQMQTQGTIIWELAWVFTVAAGLLNLLAAYDAFAGPPEYENRKNTG